MRLYVIRHADAAPPGNGIDNDHDRPLTDLGHVQCETLAKAFQSHDVELEQLVSSPLLRARQTAEDIKQHWATPLRDVTLCDELAPDGKARKLSKFLRSLKTENVGIVGHMPDLSDYLVWLLGSRKVQVPLEKAGAAYLECGEDLGKGDGVLIWLVTPSWCA
jgi:phosphohistidine phosphatase